MITDSLQHYEERALRLATEPAELARLRARLAQNRLTHPLFDTDAYRRHLEAAYRLMWERWQRGESPASLVVPAH
jgi:predicted O-linked N-acetylglucosamine transferase (SPINDLY family)